MSQLGLVSQRGVAPRARPAPFARRLDFAGCVGTYWALLSDVALSLAGGELVMRLAWNGSVAERPTPPPQRLALPSRTP